MAKRKAKNVHLVEPTWGQSEDGGPPLTELTSEAAGPLSSRVVMLSLLEALLAATAFCRKEAIP